MMMTDAPKTIWAFPKKDWFNAGASTHKITVAGAKDHEYTLTSTVAAQLNAADELAERAQIAFYWIEGKGNSAASVRLRNALTAYRKAKDEAQ